MHAECYKMNIRGNKEFDMSNKNLSKRALKYHSDPQPGKIGIAPTKPLISQEDLALAYSPGVAVPCEEIFRDKESAYDYTSKGNMVAVISNGTAILGLGNLGAAASKPVMEGKSVLFKKFADIDSIDVEVDAQDADEFTNVVKNIGNSWGGINLEDIKSPECFIIEEKLKAALDIPVFHDDQHGTAIITAAGLINAAHLTKRNFKKLKIVVSGAGAAAIACIELIKSMGVPHNNVILCDSKGTIFKGRKEDMNEWKEKHAAETKHRTISEALKGADVFLGLSVKNVVSKDMVASMAAQPIIFAMANPDPEIAPEDVLDVRKDAIIATGRSDYNNQINNVMGFPYIFRGALDVRAKTINEEMKMAAANALAELARAPVPDEVSNAYQGRKMTYGQEYIIPVPFDPRLISTVPVAVAKAAMDSGVARKKLDLSSYKNELESRLNPKSNYMNLVFTKARSAIKKIVLAEGEEEKTIRAAIRLRDDNIAKPILIGRMSKITEALKNIGSDDDLEGIEIRNAAVCKNLDGYIEYLYDRLQRRGYLHRDCARMVKTDRNIFAGLMVAMGDADGMVTGLTKNYTTCLADALKVVDPAKNEIVFSYSILIGKEQNIIIADSSVNRDPTPTELSKIAKGAAKVAKKIGDKPRLAFLASRNFDERKYESVNIVKDAVEILKNEKVNFEFDGEMTAEVALNKKLKSLYPFMNLSAPANVLIMPNICTASISTQLLEQLAGGVFVGPILTGLTHQVQIVQNWSSATDIYNFAALAASGS